MTDWERQPGFDLLGKRAVVVGFANPAGAAIASALAEAGADVALAATSMDGDEVMAARRASKAIAEMGRKTVRQAWDVVLPKNVQVSYRQLVKEFGAPSVLVYNGDHMVAKPFEQVSDTEFARMQAVNTNGALYAARNFLHELPEGEPGRIIIVSNVFAERGVENLTAYTVARAGANALVAGLSQEYGGRNVTVNAISTGWMEWTAGRGPDDINENKLMRFIPMRRFGGPQEVGGLAVLLASDASGYINGQVLHVDGGIMTHL